MIFQTNFQCKVQHKKMIVPSISNIRASIADNNKLITEMNKFILDNYQKPGDYLNEHRLISTILDYKRKVVSNAWIIQGMLWCYLLNGGEKCKGKKFWLYVKLYTHRKIIKESVEIIRMLKHRLMQLQMLMNPLGFFSARK